MTSALALGCLCFVSSTAICFFTLLFAVQNPLLLLLIGLQQNAVPLETYDHLGEGERNGINLTAHGRWKCRTKSPLQHRCDMGADFSPLAAVPTLLLLALCRDFSLSSVLERKRN